MLEAPVSITQKIKVTHLLTVSTYIQVLIEIGIIKDWNVASHIFWLFLGLAYPVKVTSHHRGSHKNQYHLKWEVESKTPIIRYRLQYRKANVSHD